MTDGGVITGDDGIARCWWCGDDPIYRAYHDDEWGRPLRDERGLFELLTLEGFQAGLAWITILRKRPAFRAAFSGFEIETVAGFGAKDVTRLLADPGIVRHRGKITAAIANAQAVVALHELGSSLSEVVWAHVPEATRSSPRSIDQIPAKTPESTELARTLRRHGMRFVGPTTVYAFMQSAGIVDDHLARCHRAGGGRPRSRDQAPGAR